MTKGLSDPGLLNLLFPFHFILDNNLDYVQLGSSLSKTIIEPKRFVDDFLLVRPGLGIQYLFDSIADYHDQVFILKIKREENALLFKGQFIHLSDEQQLLFVGSPWITNEDVFEKAGLKIKDFAVHDSLIDLLQIVKVQQMAAEDVRKMNQELIGKNQELLKINSELDKFVYSISHDLRSPLLSIKGIIQMIPIKEKLSEGTMKFLTMAEKSINRLDHTVQEILDYSRNARLELKPSAFSLEQTIEAVFADLSFASATPVDCSLEISGPTVVTSDKHRIETLLKNIIGNAVKYHNPNISHPWVKVSVSNTKSHVTIKVADNGMGISEKNLPKVFDMFYRGNSSVEGTGLGLYICNEIIGRLGGTIDVASELGTGSTFTIVFPNTNKQ